MSTDGPDHQESTSGYCKEVAGQGPCEITDRRAGPRMQQLTSTTLCHCRARPSNRSVCCEQHFENILRCRRRKPWFGQVQWSTRDDLGVCVSRTVAHHVWKVRYWLGCRDSTDPTSNAVDFLPFLQYLPSSSTARAQRLHERIVGIIGGILDDMGERLQAGESLPDCLAKSLLENRDKEHHDRLDIIMLCAAFIVPGFASVSVNVSACRKWCLSSHDRLHQLWGHLPWPFHAIPKCRNGHTTNSIGLWVGTGYQQPWTKKNCHSSAQS